MHNIFSSIRGTAFCLLIAFLLQVNSMTTIYAAAATAAINYGPDPLQGARPAVGYAKVRIWRTNLPDRAGHVSLETDESYISIWPNSGATDTVKAAEFAGGFTPIIHAPALNMENYEKDFALEKSTPPDCIYLISVKSQDINTCWRIIRERYAAPAGTDVISLRGVTWLAPSGSAFRAPVAATIHVNCASAALIALGIGGIDIKDFVSRKTSGAHLTQSVAEALSNTPREARQLLEAVGLWSFYDSVIKPDDIAELLTTVMRERTKESILTSVREGGFRLPGVDSKKHSIAVDEIVKRLPARTDERRISGLGGVGNLTEDATTPGIRVLELNREIVSEIDRIYDRDIAIATTGLAAVVGGLLGSAIGGEKGAVAGAVIGGGGGLAVSQGCTIM